MIATFFNRPHQPFIRVRARQKIAGRDEKPVVVRLLALCYGILFNFQTSTKMKSQLLLLLIAFTSAAAFGQLDSTHWYFTLADAEPKLDVENQLIISVDLPPGWGLYSTDFKQSAIGPAPTAFQFEKATDYVALDALRPTRPLVAEEPGFDFRYTYFATRAEFRQCIKLVHEKTKIKGVVKGQLFHLQSGEAVPFEKPFDLVINLSPTH